MTETNWLENLKPGDVVLIDLDDFEGTLVESKVIKLTTKWIVTEGDRRFYRRDGTEVGRSGFRFASLREPTDENRQKARRIKIRKFVEHICRKTLEAVVEDRPTLTDDLLINILTNLRAARKIWEPPAAVDAPAGAVENTEGK